MGHIAFADLLAPHRIVKTVIFKQGLVRTCFDNSSALKNVDAVGMRERAQTMGDQNHHVIVTSRHVAHHFADFALGD